MDHHRYPKSRHPSPLSFHAEERRNGELLHRSAPKRAAAKYASHRQALATALTGSFLLFLGIDLLATQTMGMSLGLVREVSGLRRRRADLDSQRFMLDGRDSHASDLARYDPPVVTRVLLAMSWVVA